MEQTTYENFRYRYDSKENPYNRGLMKNIKETLLSLSIPPMVNFREWVIQEDDSIVDSMSRRYFGDMVKSNGKLDMELGKPPIFLQNLEYSGVDDSLKKAKGENANLEPYFFSAEMHDDKYGVNGSIVDGDGSELALKEATYQT